jgi:hypothetical protein
MAIFFHADLADSADLIRAIRVIRGEKKSF